MEILRILDPPSETEINSYVTAFGRAPWLETIPESEATKYLSKFRQRGAAVLGVYQSQEHAPYLYAHFTDYHDVDKLVADEFAGDEAFYLAENPETIAKVFAGRGRVCFISNIHADKTAPVNPENKPRLKALGEVIEECFTQTDADCVAYFTHKDTAVYSQSSPEALSKFDVEIQDYDVQASDSSEIDSLVLIIVTPKKTEGV